MRTYSAYGNVRGDCGHKHQSIDAAKMCFHDDSVGCARQGGYSDRFLLRVYENNKRVEPTEAELEEWAYQQ